MSKESTPAATEVNVDGLIRQMTIEAETQLRKSLSDRAAAKAQFDAAESQIVYWQGRADSLRDLVKKADEAAAQPLTPDVAAATTEPAASAVNPDEASSEASPG